MKTHGLSNSRVYHIWEHMKRRVNPNNKNRKINKNYSDRGIEVCREWKSFEAFYKDMGEPPTNKHTLERLNNDKGYSPDNCKWATREEQMRNTRRTILVTYNGLTLCAKDWSLRLGGGRNFVANRIRKGWNPIDAVSIPKGQA